MKIHEVLNNLECCDKMFVNYHDLAHIGFIKENSKEECLGALRVRKTNSLPHIKIGMNVRYLKHDLVDFFRKNVHDKCLDDEYSFRDIFFVKRKEKPSTSVKTYNKKEDHEDEADKTMKALWKVIEDLNNKLSFYLDNR